MQSFQERWQAWWRHDVFPDRELPFAQRLSRAIQRTLRISWNSLAKFISDECFSRASALAFAILLAIVPLLMLGFAMFAAFQQTEVFQQEILEFIQANFLIAFGEEQQQQIIDQIMSLLQNASQIQPASVVFLIFTATFAGRALESAFDRIWRSRTQRPLLQSLKNFWILITIGPIILGFSLWALPSIELPLLAVVSPLIVTTVGLFLIYTFIPNQTVPLGAAFVGALVAAVIWEIVKVAFAFYVSNYGQNVYENLYSSLWIVPILVLVVYIGFLGILLGAQVAVVVGNREYASRIRLTLNPEDAELPSAFYHYELGILLALTRHWHSQGGPMSEKTLRRMLEVKKSGNLHNFRSALAALFAKRLILESSGRVTQFGLALHPDKVTLGELMERLNMVPTGTVIGAEWLASIWAEIRAAFVDADSQSALSQTLSQLADGVPMQRKAPAA